MIKMGASKYQVKAKTNIQNAQQGHARARYYDEKTLTPKKSSGFAIFVVIILVLTVGFVGIGSMIDKQAAEAADQTNANPYYTVDADQGEELAQAGYKTPISMTTIEGNVISLEDHAGKVVVLYFHFLSCSACTYHSPNLQAAMAKFSTAELLVISITVSPSDTDAALQAWATNNGYSFELVRDSDYSLGSRFGAQYTPHTIYIAPDGDSSVRHTGAQTVSEIEGMISDLL